MRIGIIAGMFGAPWGGSEELWADMAEEARADGHEVMACVFHWPFEPPRLQQLREKGVIIVKRLRPRHFTIWKRFGKLHVLRFSEMTAFEPDILCISQGGTHDVADSPEFSRLEMLLNTPIPYVVLCHVSETRRLPPQMLRSRVVRYFQAARRVFFIAEENRVCAERQLAQTISNSTVIQNPVNLSSTDAIPWPGSDGDFQFACVARLDASHKGHDILLESLKGEAWANRHWRLRFYGTGSDQAYISALAAFYGIAHRVQLVGHVDDVRSIWADNHILLMASRLEGTPLSLVEAMLCGRPAVVTDVGGNSEWIQEGITGFVAEAPTAAFLGRALERAWDARARWAEMGQMAHQVASEKFDPHAGRTLLDLMVKDASAFLQAADG